MKTGIINSKTLSSIVLSALVIITASPTFPQQQEGCFDSVLILTENPAACKCQEHFRLWEGANSWCPGSSGGELDYWACETATVSPGKTKCEETLGKIGTIFKCHGRNKPLMVFCTIYWTLCITGCIGTGGLGCGMCLSGGTVSCMPCDTIECYADAAMTSPVYGLRFSKWASDSKDCPPSGS